MSLIEERPINRHPDLSKKETIEIESPADGCRVKFDVYSPHQHIRNALPLVIGPHPITWTASQDYNGGLDGLMRKYHPGYKGLADKYDVVIVLPHGHHHMEDLCSLAGSEQISDIVFIIDELGKHDYHIDNTRVYTCGLSMGGQEALVLAGKYPERITAAFAFNPIVDLKAWYDELSTSEIPEIKEYNTAARIAHEVGGKPNEVPEAYVQRSATNYVEGLAKVPTMIFWSEYDLIVPRQATHHAYHLYQLVKKVNTNSPISEYNHTLMHGHLEYDQVTRWQLHEWCDYDLALRWILCHKK